MTIDNPFHSFIPAFKQRVFAVDATILSGKPYPVRYFETIRDSLDYTLNIYSDLLHQTQQFSKLPIAKTCLFDYGAGNGLLGLFAKFIGYGKVILIERDPDFLEASVRLSALMQIHIDGFLQDDLQESIDSFSKCKPDVLVATDVIEHIYDLDRFFLQAKQLNPNLVSGFTTASNSLHPIKRRKLMALQRQDEQVGNADPMQAHASFKSLRAEILNKQLPELNPFEKETWIRITRGLKDKDIRKAVQHWEQTGELPTELQHPTNTCHPYTGSWTERLLSMEEYESIAHRTKWNLQIAAGYYNTDQSGFRRMLARFANQLVKKTGNRWAPFLLLFFHAND